MRGLRLISVVLWGPGGALALKYHQVVRVVFFWSRKDVAKQARPASQGHVTPQPHQERIRKATGKAESNTIFIRSTALNSLHDALSRCFFGITSEKFRSIL